MSYQIEGAINRLTAATLTVAEAIESDNVKMHKTPREKTADRYERYMELVVNGEFDHNDD